MVIYTQSHLFTPTPNSRNSKAAFNNTQFRKKVRKDYGPVEAYKRDDFEKLAVYWNSEVDEQD